MSGRSLVVFEELYLNGEKVAAHTDLDDAEQTIAFVEPEISTTATGENGEKELLISDRVKIKDTIAYANLMPNREYTIHGDLVDRETGETLPDGRIVATFTPQEKDGAVYVTFEIDGRTLAGKEIVAFEKLYLDDVEIAAHEDVQDEGQTISFLKPEISTTATGENGEKELLISDRAKIVDTISYGNITPGREYTIKGALRDKESGEAVGDSFVV